MLAILFVSASATAGKILFEENFRDGWQSRWVPSKARTDFGKFEWTAGVFPADPNNKGIKTSQDAHFYALSAKVAPFSNKDKDLVVQYSVKHEQNLDCGGAYVKLLPPMDPEKFDGNSQYYLMFGPDICGSTRKTHAIVNYKGENKLIKKTIPPKFDQLTHFYTFVLHPNQSYEVFIDHGLVEKGHFYDDWEFLQPRMIKDPSAKKPADWDDRAKIPDPTDTKPAEWDSIPATIDDPEAKRPEDWDEELDGQWERPKIRNPAYKGEWKPRMIENPNYKGPWIHPEIPNPAFVEDQNIYVFPEIAHVGLDLWQVKSGTIFDHFLITDSLDEATKVANEVFPQSARDAEKALKDKLDEEQRKKSEEETKESEKDEERIAEEDTLRDEL